MGKGGKGDNSLREVLFLCMLSASGRPSGILQMTGKRGQ